MNPKNLFTDTSSLIFYLLFLLTLASLFLTHPFFVFPFDTYIHLAWIEKQDPSVHSVFRETWHWLWSNLFHLLHLDRYSIFQKGYIIHYTQLIAVFLMLFYFSRTVFTYLFKQITALHTNYLAYWSTILWFTLVSTYSAYHHEVWIVWYSVTYQITLPLMLFSTGIFISFLYAKEQPLRLKLTKLSAIALTIFAILVIHPMELIYIILYLFIFAMIHIKTILIQIRKLGYWSLPLIILFVLILMYLPEIVQLFAYREIPILQYISLEKLPMLYEEILRQGKNILEHYNRNRYFMNEMIYLDLLLLLITTVTVIYRYLTGKACILRIHLYLFILIGSLTLFIPQSVFSAGMASLLTYPSVVYRFAYSTLLFLALPIFVYYTLSLFKAQKTYWINLSILSIILATLYYSAYSHTTSHHYARNLISIAHMYTTHKRSFSLTKAQIKKIGEIVDAYEKKNHTEKPLYYYARPDIAYVIKYIYHKNAWAPIKPKKKRYEEFFKTHKDKNYTPVLIETPDGFPPYHPYISSAH